MQFLFLIAVTCPRWFVFRTRATRALSLGSKRVLQEINGMGEDGWGETEAGGQSNTLKEARMKVMSNDDCTAVIKRVSKEKEEFLGLPENKKEIKITEYEIIKFAKLPYKMRLTRIKQNKTIK